MYLRLVTAVLACLVILAPVAYPQAQELDQVIAIVNDEAVTMSEYRSRFQMEQLQTQRQASVPPGEIDLEILNLLVDEKLQTQFGETRGMSIPETAVDDTLSAMAAQNNISMAELVNEIERQGISLDQFRRSIRDQRMLQRVREVAVYSRVTVSESEIDYHLQAHRELYQTSESYEVSHLFVSTAGMDEEQVASQRENVEFIYAGLAQGGSFDKFVQDFSDGENKDEGGYLGWRQEDQLPDLFVEGLRNVPVGDVTEILESPNGFHILKLHGKEGDVNIVSQQRVRHILIRPGRRDITDEEALQLIEQLAAEIRGGTDFAQAARLNSDDTASAEDGGNLGWVSPGETAPAFEAAIKEIPLNTLSEPIRTQFGFHLAEVLERRKHDISQDMSRARAENEVFRRKSAEMYQNWFDRLRDRAYIEYVYDN